MKIIWTLACLFLVAFSATKVFGQDDYADPADEIPQEAEVDLDDSVAQVSEPTLISSQHVHTSYLFPSSPDKKFVVADSNPVELLVGFSNVGDKNLNVSFIQAALMYPQDHRYFIQNYSRWSYSQIVKPEEQATFLYKFLPDAGLDVRDFDLTVIVFYNDGAEGYYATTVYNDTVSFVDRSDAVDAQTFFTYVGVIAVAGLAAFIAYKNFFAAPKKSRARKIETGTRAEVPVHENEWLAGTSAVKATPRAQSPRRSTKAASK
eukprot:TRINITY_DN14614_c0_g1_i1.p2 TRINITY_DN14614_c0_g1~~TRINITY_DN14614_c0_g1_i1.p2  ORF type:complete len:284 (+),score=89.33 TRINITY_DN14614_c0_g1_i1:69-854(+)